MGEFDAEPVFTGTGVSYRCPQCKMVVPPGKVGHVCSVPLDTGPVITAARIRARRVAAGMSLRALAERLGVTEVYLGQVERGVSSVESMGFHVAQVRQLFPGIDAPEDPIATAQEERWREHRKHWEAMSQAMRDMNEELAKYNDEPAEVQWVTTDIDRPEPECDYAALGYPETAVGVSLDVESVKEVACVALDSMSRWLRALADGRL